MSKAHKVKISLRLPQTLLDFVRAYGNTDTEALENALNKFRQLEQAQEQTPTTQEQKQTQQLDLLREKERIKTQALADRQKLRPQRQRSVRIDWAGAEGCVDSDSHYEDSYGDTF